MPLITFANPFGLLGLLSLPAIVAVHMFQRRFPPLQVAGLHLWGVEAEVREAGRKRDRLPITASLLLELLAALLLTLVLSQPRLGSAGSTTHVVIVLDDSASMQGVGGDGTSFRDAAVELLQQRFAALDPESVATIILTGRRPVMLAGPAADWKTARDALDKWKPTAPRHDFHSAWDLAAQFAGDSGRVLFLTDRLPDESVPLPKTMEAVSLGSRTENVAFTAARWNLKPTAGGSAGEVASEVVGYRGELFLRVHNFGSGIVSVRVEAKADDERAVFDRDLTIAANAAESVTAIVPGGLGRINIKLTTRTAAADGLPADSEVTLVEPVVKKVRVAVTLPDSSVAYRQIQRVLKILPHVQQVAAESAHLIIGPAGTLPRSEEKLWWLGIGPLENTLAAKKDALTPSTEFPFVIEKRHPLMDGVELDGVKWGGVQPVNFAGTPLISAGPHILLSRLKGTRTVAYLLNIDLAASSLTDFSDWPILLQNLIALRRNDLPGLTRWNFRIGEEIRLLPPDEATGEDAALTLVGNDETRPVAAGRVVHLPPVKTAGVYEFRNGETTIGRFAVNFLDQRESDLTTLAGGKRPAVDDDAANGFLLDEPLSWLILAGIVVVVAAMLLNWLSLQPRRSTGMK